MRSMPYQSMKELAATESPWPMTSVPAVLAPVAPSQKEQVTAPAVLLTMRIWRRIIYGCVSVNPTGPASEVTFGFSILVVRVLLSATGPNLKDLLPAMDFSPYIPN